MVPFYITSIYIICFYYMNFSFNAFLVSISGLLFVFICIFDFYYANWIAAKRREKAAKKDDKILYCES